MVQFSRFSQRPKLVQQRPSAVRWIWTISKRLETLFLRSKRAPSRATSPVREGEAPAELQNKYTQRLNGSAKTSFSTGISSYIALAVSLCAFAEIVGNSGGAVALGQIGYPVQTNDFQPSQVFSGSQSAPYTSDWPSQISRPSPYSDYRSGVPITRPITPVPQPGYNGIPTSPSSAWNSGPGSSAVNGTFGAADPYSSGRYIAPSTVPYDVDPRFPTPYAGNLYRPSRAPQDLITADTVNPGCHGGCLTPGLGTSCDTDPSDFCGRGDCTLYMPFINMGYYGGTTPSTGLSEMFVPLLQSHTELLYADIRGLYNTQSAYQGSFGGGLRSLIRDSLILGGYGFYDFRQSAQHNQFQQVTVGAEIMTWLWEARSNGYIPTYQGGGGGGAGTGTAFLQNGLIFLGGTQQRALSGVDGEFGMLVAADPCASKELRAFAGGYYFNGPNGGQDIPGVYGRLEARIYDLNFLGQGSRLEAGVLSSYDEVNRFQVTALFNVRIAFGGSTCPGGLSRIERRMLDRVWRRLDVLTSNQSTSTETGTATINGTQVNSVVFVRPTDDLQTAVNNAPVHSVIVVEGAKQVVANGVTLNSGQTLAGGGSQINVVGDSSGRVESLTLPGTTPTICRPDTLGPVITLASNTSVLGVKTQGGNYGIFGDHTDNVNISNVTICQTGSDGLHLNIVNGLCLNDVTITQTGGLGALLQNVNDSKITNFNISQSVGSELYYNCGMNVHINGLKVDATGATDDAVRFHTQMHGTYSNFDIRNSAFNGLTFGSSTNVTLDHINLTNITGDGFQTYQSGTFALSNFDLNNVAGNGLVINNTSLVSVNSSIFTNVNNDISFLNVTNYISGSGNVSTGQTTLSTGTTNGGGSIQFTTPNATVQ